MIKRRHPEQSDEQPEGEANEPASEGQNEPEPAAGDPSEDETGADPAASAGDGDAAASEPSGESTDQSTDQSDTASAGRKRSRRRRGKAAAKDEGGSADTSIPRDDDSKPTEEGTTPAGERDGDTATSSDDTSASEGAEEPAAAEAASGDGASTPEGGEPPVAAPPPRRGGRGLAVLALLIALIAAGGAGWMGWRVLELERQVAAVPEQRREALAPLASQDALDTVEQRLDQVQQRLSSLANEQQRLQGEHQAVLDDLRTRLETVETALQNMRERRERDGADWRMAEVRYLVSIAVQRVAISGDIAGAVAALQAADQSLARMGDPRVLDLRKQIVADIERLQAVEPADVEGIALRIQNLAPRIPHLEPPAPPSPPAAEASTEPETADDGQAQGWWASIREQLGSLVTVRREPEAAAPAPAQPAPGPAPSAELPAAERLLLALKDASRAALNQDPQVYDEAIGRALNVLDDGYAESGAVVDRFRETLQELRERRVTTDMPDLGPTLERTQRLAARLENGGSGAASQGDN